MFLRLLLCAMLLIAFSASVHAQGRWESATNIGQESTSSAELISCIYVTTSGYRFSTTYRDYTCPYSAKINRETGKAEYTESGLFKSSGNRWEGATNIGQEPTSSAELISCIYVTTSGYRFSTTYHGYSCPNSVKINPETGKVEYTESGLFKSSGNKWEDATHIGQEPTNDEVLSIGV